LIVWYRILRCGTCTTAKELWQPSPRWAEIKSDVVQSRGYGGPHYVPRFARFAGKTASSANLHVLANARMPRLADKYPVTPARSHSGRPGIVDFTLSNAERDLLRALFESEEIRVVVGKA